MIRLEKRNKKLLTWNISPFYFDSLVIKLILEPLKRGFNAYTTITTL